MECYAGYLTGIKLLSSRTDVAFLTHQVQLYQQIVYTDTIPDKQKNKIVMIFSEVDKRLVDGADEHLEILDLALRVAGILAQS